MGEKVSTHHHLVPTPIEKAIANPGNTRAAINAKCWDCIHDPTSGEGPWLTQVTNCPSDDCPLYSVRPLNKEARDIIKLAKIANMTKEEKVKYDAKVKVAKERMLKMRN